MASVLRSTEIHPIEFRFVTSIFLSLDDLGVVWMLHWFWAGCLSRGSDHGNLASCVEVALRVRCAACSDVRVGGLCWGWAFCPIGAEAGENSGQKTAFWGSFVDRDGTNVSGEPVLKHRFSGSRFGVW